MMRCRPFLVLVALMLVLVGCKKKPDPIVITPDSQKNHLQRNHIFGIVRNIDTKTYYVEADSLTAADTARIPQILKKRNPDFSTWQRFSADGYLMHYTKFNANKDTLLRQVYYYDWKALLRRWEEFDSTGTVVTHGKYLYDRNNFISGEQIFQGDSVVMAFTYTTDGIGNIIRTSQAYGEYTTFTESKYNVNGQVEKIIEHEPNGKVFKTVKIEYDNYGDEVNRCVYKAGDQMLEYTYNTYSQEGKQLKTIYEDKIHHLKETKLYFDYDEQNNWRTEVTLRNNQVFSIRTRRIIYYQSNN